MLPGHDGRTMTVIANVGRERNPHPTALHPLDIKYLGRQPQPGARPRRHAVKPNNFQLPSIRLAGAALYRPLRVDGEQTTATLQSKVVLYYKCYVFYYKYLPVRTLRLTSIMTCWCDLPRQTSRVASLIQTVAKALAHGTRTTREHVQAS
jgi:hypothetical protein